MSFFFLHLPYLQTVHQGSQGVSHPLGGPSNQPIHLPTYPPINGHRPGPRTYISVSLLPSEAQNNPPTQNHHQFPNTSPHNHPPPAPAPTPTATMTTPTGYEGTYPTTTSTPPDPSLQTFLSNFYRLSDSPAHNDEWTAQFRDDAVIRLGPKTAQGREGSSPFPHTFA